MLTGLLPQCVLVTDGKTHDRRAIQDLRFQPGDLLIFDRAYLDYAWLYQLHQGRAWFVTRLKSNSCYEIIQEQTAAGPILADQIICLGYPKGQASYPEPLRRVHYRDPETGKEYVFLTNRQDLSALEVAELYRRRWQIELFFKWLKQNLKIKAFYGTSKNAVLIQIWTALIAYLLLVWVKFKTKVGLGTSGTLPFGPNHAPGTHEFTRLAWSFDHQTSDNTCYSISVPDSNDIFYKTIMPLAPRK